MATIPLVITRLDLAVTPLVVLTIMKGNNFQFQFQFQPFVLGVSPWECERWNSSLTSAPTLTLPLPYRYPYPYPYFPRCYTKLV